MRRGYDISKSLGKRLGKRVQPTLPELSSEEGGPFSTHLCHRGWGGLDDWNFCDLEAALK
jgi:hypothetical protein